MSYLASSHLVRPLLHSLLTTGLLALTACGGGGSSNSPAAPTTPPEASAQREAPAPFWTEDAPIRPSLAHMFAANTGTGGTVISLSADEKQQVQVAAAHQRTEQAMALPSAVAVQRRTVTGLYSDSFHTTAGVTQQPFDLSLGTVVEALAPVAGGGFETIPATAKRADGSYLINGVPEGAHWVHIGSTYVWTSGSFIDWGSDAFGRPDIVYANNPTMLTVNASNLGAWQANDNLAWAVPMQGTSFALTLTSPFITNPPAVGDTALGDFSLDFGITAAGDGLFIPLLSAAKGDQAYLNQLGTSSGTDYRTLVKSLVLPALTQTDGTPGALNSGFVDIDQSGSLRLKWDRPAFISHVSELNPTALATSDVLGLSTSALAPSYGVPSDAFSLFEFNTFGSTALDFGRVHYGSPFPADWTQILESYVGFTVRYMAPGATVALPFERFMYGVDLVPTGADPSLNVRPRMSPVLSPRINGKTLFANQLAVGTSPHFSWQVPAVGTPDRYLLTLRRLVAVGPRSSSRFVARFYSSDTSMDIPPGLLQPGEVYFLTISAIAAGSPLSAPLRSQLPYSFATMMSALISP